MEIHDRVTELEEQLRQAKVEARRTPKRPPLDAPGGLLYWTIGRAILETRRSLDITQEELAQRVGFGRTSVANIESGRQRLPIATLYDIADALGVQAIALLPRNEDV